MPQTMSRRTMMRGVLASGAAASMGWPFPALAQGEEVVPFSDLPTPAAGGRVPPSLASFLTPIPEFFTVAHYPIPEYEAASWRMRVTGLVDRPVSLTLEDLHRRPRMEQIVGFECAGNNNARGNPLVGNARWVGTSLAALLKDAGVRETAREVVFYGADSGLEDVSHGGVTERVPQHFGRSLSLDDALRPEVMVAWEMNGEPLPRVHGAPLRLIVPGSYGVGNVKWLNHVHVQETRYAGRFMSRDYVTLQGRRIGDQLVWDESWVSRIRLKSAIGRVTRAGNTCRVIGFALTDGTPLRTVEVKIDDGPWQPATLDARNTPHSWQLFSYTWNGATPGAHTLVSRATDARGQVQPSEDDLALKKTRWENNGMFVRRITLP
jgi:DMSO/TMAO reductase YedYZ molybdopterin-dependent catalytic subunit